VFDLCKLAAFDGFASGLVFLMQFWIIKTVMCPIISHVHFAIVSLWSWKHSITRILFQTQRVKMLT
jgi:hypothetical protein